MALCLLVLAHVDDRKCQFFFSPVMNADFSVSALSKCFTLDVTSPLGEENAEKSALLVDGCM